MSKPGKQTKAQAQRSKRIAMNKNAARLLPGRLSDTLCEAARIAGATAGTVTLASTLSATPAHALPQNGTVVGGNASIAQTGASSLNINQTTNSAIINWQGYNISAGELVQYTQPGTNSIVLNRVTGGDPSAILGSLTANGQVWVINPNGLVVGAGAKVQTGSFLGSTLGISNEDFSAGNYRLTGNPSSLASIINHGNIQAADGGYVVLAAPSVTNTGVIAAHLGKVALASGEQLTLGFQGNDLIDIVITEEAASGALGVKNSGSITADGGSVLLSAKVATDLLKEVVNNEGIIQATSIVEKDGVIILDGGNNGVANSGTLDASGRDAGEQGGTVKVLGDRVELASGAIIDASGDAGGGTVLVGGDFHGAGPEPNSSATTVAQGAVINADAVTDGDGGKVAVWSDGTTVFHGDISARGGAAGGDGGRAEVSGKEHLAVSGLADLRAPNGRAGVLELDPGSVQIVDGDTAPAAMDTITDGWINSQLEGSDLVISTTDSTNGAEQNINLDSGVGIAWNSTNTLTLSADSEIYLRGTITAPNGSLRLNFDQSGAGAPLWFRAAVNVPDVLISGSGTRSSLVGSNDGNTFTVTGQDSGKIDDCDFIGVGQLSGSWGNDSFIIERSGSLSGGVDGFFGNDTLDLSAKDNVTFNHAERWATDVASVYEIQKVVGNGANSTFIGRDSHATYNVSAVDSGNLIIEGTMVLEFTGFGNLTGGSWNDTFNFHDGGSLSGAVNAGLGQDTLNYASRTGDVLINLETRSATGIGSSFSGMESVVGNGATSTIIGPDAGETFTVAGADAGTVGALAFTGVGNLAGGTGNDTFVLQAAGSLSGNVAGGDGADALDLSAKPGDVIFDKQNSSATDIVGTFSGIESVAGNGASSTIVGADAGDVFTVTGADAGTVGDLAFSSVSNLIGGAGNDSFLLQAGGALSGVVDGGLGGSDSLDLGAMTGAVTIDQENAIATGVAGFTGIEAVVGNGAGTTIIGVDEGQDFVVTAVDTGTAGALDFVNVANLTGGSGNDSFIFQDGGTLSGTVEGGGGLGEDTLNYAFRTGTVIIDQNLHSAPGVTGAVSGIEAVVGNGAGTTIIGVDGGQDFLITAADTGTAGALKFREVGNLTGGSGDDAFIFQDGGSLSGAVNGGLGVDTLNFASRTGEVVINQQLSETVGIAKYSGIESVVGNGAGTTIIGTDAGQDFVVTAADSGTAGALDFVSVANLTGGSGADSFIFQDGGKLSGVANGGLGDDTLNYASRTGEVVINQQLSETVGIAEYSGIESVVGNGGGTTIIGTDGGQDFVVAAADTGTAGALNFANVANLTGGSGNDSFIFQDGGSLSGAVTGGLGADTLNYASRTGDVVINQQTQSATGVAAYSGVESVVGNGATSAIIGADAGETFTVTGADAGTAGSLAFTGVGNLTGGTGDDSFILQAAGTLSGKVDGGGGADSLDLSQKVGQDLAFDLQNSTVTGNVGTFTAVESFLGNGAQSTIIGADAGETFTVAGADSGTVGALAFTGVGNLTGGTGNDTFVLQAAGSLSGNVAGGNGADALDLSAKLGDVIFDKQNSSATGIAGTFSGIESVAGNGATSTIIGADAGEIFTVTGADAGTVGDLAFSGVGSLAGGAGNDSFLLQAGGALSGVVDGGLGGSDSLDLGAMTGAVTIDQENAIATGVAGFTGIETVVGNGAGTTIIGVDGGQDFVVTAVDTGTAGTLNFANVANLTGGSGNDSFIFQDGGSLSGAVTGGLGADTLNYASRTGDVVINQQTQSATGVAAYSGMESVVGNGATSTIIGADAGEAFTVAGADSGTAGSLAFTGVGSLTGGTGDDSFILQAAGTLSGKVDGGGGSDSLDLGQKVGQDLAFDLQNSTVTGNVGTFTAVESILGNGAQSTIIGRDAGETFTVAGADSGTVGALGFAKVGNLTGGSGNDSFVLTSGGTLSGSVSGGGGNDRLDLSAKVGRDLIFDLGASSATDIAGTFSGVERVVGNGVKSTIIGADTGEAFAVTALDSGTAGTLQFTAVSNLTGGSGNDSFIFEDSGSLSGAIQGGLGVDTLNYASRTGTVVIDQNLSSVALGAAGAVSGIESVVGNGAGTTIIGVDGGQDFVVTAVDTGTAGTLNFANVANLTGGSGNDSFIFQDGGSLSGAVNGGLGADTLNYASRTGTVVIHQNLPSAPGVTGAVSGIEAVVGNGAGTTIIGVDGGQDFLITATDTGTAGLLKFSGVGNLTGGSGADSFAFQDGGTLSGVANGGLGEDTLNFASKTGAVVIDQKLTEAVEVAKYSGIEAVVGNGAGTTIIGVDGGEDFVVTAADTGTAGVLKFREVGNLTGGSGADSFIFQDGGKLSGVANGGLGEDTLNFASRTGEVVINQQLSETVDVAKYSGIEAVVGNGAGTTIIGADGGQDFVVTAADTGTAGALKFREVANLTGGSGADSFIFQDGGTLSGVAHGGLGEDTLNFASRTGAVVINQQLSETVGIAKYSGIEAVVGNGAGTTIMGVDGGQDFVVTAADTGTAGALKFREVANLTGGSGNDSFIFQLGGTLQGNVDGGGGAGSDLLDLSAKVGRDLIFNLQQSSATDIEGTFRGIETVVGNGVRSTIVGRDISQAYNITGADSGTVGAGEAVDLTFRNVGNLTGGSRDDYFFIKPDGSVSGSLDGGLDRDSLYVSSKPAVTFDLEQNRVIDYVEAFTGFEKIAGNGVDSKIIGRNQNQTFTITGDGAGTVGDLEFIAMTDLVGGSGDDSFVFRDAGRLTGKVDGSSGSDSLDYSARTSAVVINQETSAATGTAGFSGMEWVIGNGANSTIIGREAGQSFGVIGADLGMAGDLQFMGVGNLEGGRGHDTFSGTAQSKLSGSIVDRGGPVTLKGALTAEGTQSYAGAATLAEDTRLSADTVTLNGVSGDGKDLTIDGNAVFNTADVAGVRDLHVTGETAVNVAKISSSGTQLYDDIVTLGTAAQLSGSAVTLNAVAGGNHDLTVTSSGGGGITIKDAVTTTGKVTLQAAAGQISETGAGRISAASLTTDSAGGQSLGGANTVQSFSGRNSGPGSITFNNAASTLQLGDVQQTGGGAITITNAGNIDVAGNVETSSELALAATSGGNITDEKGTGLLKAETLDLKAGTIGVDGSDPIEIEARSVSTTTEDQVAGVSGDFVGSAREFVVTDRVKSVVLLNGIVVGGQLGSGFLEAVQLAGSNAAMAVNAQEMQKMLMLANFEEFFTQAPNAHFVDADDPALAPVQEIIPGFLSDGRPCQLIDSKMK